jgi:NADP-dependent aldehyde dehydrogenase
MKGVIELARGTAPEKPLDARPYLFELAADDVIADMRSTHEVFGPSAILVRCKSEADMIDVARRMQGQLSMAVHLETEDLELARRLMPILERRTGRIVANGFSNMVEISDAQIHGGPFPATSDPRFTAVDRFLRPIAYQNVPEALIPPALRDDNHFAIWRLRDEAPGMH